MTPLHLVFTDNQGANGLGFMRDTRVGAVEVLILHRADVNAQDANRSTPLHLASSWGKIESMQSLLEREANVNALDNKKSTPLHLALLTDNPNTVGILWNAKAKAVEVLIQHEAGVNALDENSSTPLHLASSAGRTESMELLMQHDVDVNARNKDGSTPLHLASSPWILEPVSLSIKHGANVNEQNKNKLMPLHLAAATSDIECVRLLIQRGANVDARDENNSTPLYWVSSRRRHGTNIVTLLLEHGATADLHHEQTLQGSFITFTQDQKPRQRKCIRVREADQTTLELRTIHTHLTARSFSYREAFTKHEPCRIAIPQVGELSPPRRPGEFLCMVRSQVAHLRAPRTLPISLRVLTLAEKVRKECFSRSRRQNTSGEMRVRIGRELVWARPRLQEAQLASPTVMMPRVTQKCGRPYV
ncbi:ankyrin repeat-containing domain protein [Lactarius vividus]|nr:ankyrin repeat-containing domain protein [Lactarius vividus]